MSCFLYTLLHTNHHKTHTLTKHLHNPTITTHTPTITTPTHQPTRKLWMRVLYRSAVIRRRLVPQVFLRVLSSAWLRWRTTMLFDDVGKRLRRKSLPLGLWCKRYCGQHKEHWRQHTHGESVQRWQLRFFSWETGALPCHSPEGLWEAVILV